MIQDIAPHVYDNAFHERKSLPTDYVAVFEGTKTYLTAGGTFPTVEEVKALGAVEEELVYLFTIDETAFFLLWHVSERVKEALTPASTQVFRNMQQYDESLAEDMLKTWEGWRESFLSEDRWKTYAREQMQYLVSSGAFARDSVRWPDSENVAGTEQIETYMDARFSWLDNYLQELAQQ